MLISSETVARVREASDIVELISEYVPNLKRAGKDFKGLCPFHQEKTPSFMVSPAKEIFHCFGCGVGGDVFKFVMEMEKCSYPEAIARLAEKKGIPVHKEDSPADFSGQVEKKKGLRQILNRAAQFYHKNLLESQEAAEARRYLKDKRALKEETIEKFQLGWAPRGPQALLSMALKSGVTEADLEGTGLIVRSQKDGKRIDWFRNRVIFPIFDVKGQIVAFGGRVLESKEPAGDYVPPKYINSPETEIFQKGKNLYGFYHGSKAIRDKKEILILEGYMDVIACHQAGVETAVAPLGTSLTSEQCQLLKRYVEKVTLLFDSDRAGDSAALRGAELLLEFGFLPMVAHLPEDKDADEYLKKHSAQEFDELMKKSLTVVEFNLRMFLSKNKGVPEVLQRVLAAQTLLPLVLKVDNEVIRTEMVKQIAAKVNVSEESLYAEMKKLKEKMRRKKESWPAPGARSGAEGTAGQETSASFQEKRKVLPSTEEELLRLVILHPELRASLKKSAEAVNIFSDPLCAECYRVMDAGPDLVEVGDILNQLPPAVSNWLTALLFQPVHYGDPSGMLGSLLKQIEKKGREKEKKTLEKSVVDMLNKGVGIEKDMSRYQHLTQTLKGSSKEE